MRLSSHFLEYRQCCGAISLKLFTIYTLLMFPVEALSLAAIQPCYNFQHCSKKCICTMAEGLRVISWLMELTHCAISHFVTHGGQSFYISVSSLFVSPACVCVCNTFLIVFPTYFCFCPDPLSVVFHRQSFNSLLISQITSACSPVSIPCPI